MLNSLGTFRAKTFAAATFGVVEQVVGAQIDPIYGRIRPLNPTRDAEPLYHGYEGKFYAGRVHPTGEAVPLVFGDFATGFAGVTKARAEAVARVKGASAVMASSVVYPTAGGVAGTTGYSGAVKTAKFSAQADAQAEAVIGPDVLAQCGTVTPWGVQNPTDEELALLAVMLSKDANK